ncbi:hypothetical protein KAU45_00500 [bacterium]|nr:hypothetical protein [bacterium]
MKNRIRWEAITFDEVFLDESALNCGLTFEVGVKNLYDTPLEVAFEWFTEGMDWVVDPDMGVFLLESDGSDAVTFYAGSSGELYPLPRFILRYPYREYRYYTYNDLPRFLRTQEVYPIGEPSVDGVLGEGEWEGAVVTEIFCSPDGGGMDIEETRFYWGYDDEYLYIAADCVQRGPESLLMRTEEPDGDTFQIYFDPKAVSFDQRIFMTDEGYQRAADWQYPIEYDSSLFGRLLFTD